MPERQKKKREIEVQVKLSGGSYVNNNRSDEFHLNNR